MVASQQKALAKARRKAIKDKISRRRRILKRVAVTTWVPQLGALLAMIIFNALVGGPVSASLAAITFIIANSLIFACTVLECVLFGLDANAAQTAIDLRQGMVLDAKHQSQLKPWTFLWLEVAKTLFGTAIETWASMVYFMTDPQTVDTTAITVNFSMQTGISASIIALMIYSSVLLHRHRRNVAQATLIDEEDDASELGDKKTKTFSTVTMEELPACPEAQDLSQNGQDAQELSPKTRACGELPGEVKCEEMSSAPSDDVGGPSAVGKVYYELSSQRLSRALTPT